MNPALSIEARIQAAQELTSIPREASAKDLPLEKLVEYVGDPEAPPPLLRALYQTFGQWFETHLWRHVLTTLLTKETLLKCYSRTDSQLRESIRSLYEIIARDSQSDLQLRAGQHLERLAQIDREEATAPSSPRPPPEAETIAVSAASAAQDKTSPPPAQTSAQAASAAMPTPQPQKVAVATRKTPAATPSPPPPASSPPVAEPAALPPISNGDQFLSLHPPLPQESPTTLPKATYGNGSTHDGQQVAPSSAANGSKKISSLPGTKKAIVLFLHDLEMYVANKGSNTFLAVANVIAQLQEISGTPATLVIIDEGTNNNNGKDLETRKQLRSEIYHRGLSMADPDRGAEFLFKNGTQAIVWAVSAQPTTAQKAFIEHALQVPDIQQGAIQLSSFFQNPRQTVAQALENPHLSEEPFNNWQQTLQLVPREKPRWTHGGPGLYNGTNEPIPEGCPWYWNIFVKEFVARWNWTLQQRFQYTKDFWQRKKFSDGQLKAMHQYGNNHLKTTLEYVQITINSRAQDQPIPTVENLLALLQQVKNERVPFLNQANGFWSAPRGKRIPGEDSRRSQTAAIPVGGGIAAPSEAVAEGATSSHSQELWDIFQKQVLALSQAAGWLTPEIRLATVEEIERWNRESDGKPAPLAVTTLLLSPVEDDGNTSQEPQRSWQLRVLFRARSRAEIPKAVFDLELFNAQMAHHHTELWLLLTAQEGDFENNLSLEKAKEELAAGRVDKAFLVLLRLQYKMAELSAGLEDPHAPPGQKAALQKLIAELEAWRMEILNWPQMRRMKWLGGAASFASFTLAQIPARLLRYLLDGDWSTFRTQIKEFAAHPLQVGGGILAREGLGFGRFSLGATIAEHGFQRAVSVLAKKIGGEHGQLLLEANELLRSTSPSLRRLGRANSTLREPVALSGAVLISALLEGRLPDRRDALSIASLNLAAPLVNQTRLARLAELSGQEITLLLRETKVAGSLKNLIQAYRLVKSGSAIANVNPAGAVIRQAIILLLSLVIERAVIYGYDLHQEASLNERLSEAVTQAEEGILAQVAERRPLLPEQLVLWPSSSARDLSPLYLAELQKAIDEKAQFQLRQLYQLQQRYSQPLLERLLLFSEEMVTMIQAIMDRSGEARWAVPHPTYPLRFLNTSRLFNQRQQQAGPLWLGPGRLNSWIFSELAALYHRLLVDTVRHLREQRNAFIEKRVELADALLGQSGWPLRHGAREIVQRALASGDTSLVGEAQQIWGGVAAELAEYQAYARAKLWPSQGPTAAEAYANYGQQREIAQARLALTVRLSTDLVHVGVDRLFGWKNRNPAETVLGLYESEAIWLTALRDRLSQAATPNAPFWIAAGGQLLEEQIQTLLRKMSGLRREQELWRAEKEAGDLDLKDLLCLVALGNPSLAPAQVYLSTSASALFPSKEEMCRNSLAELLLPLQFLPGTMNKVADPEQLIRWNKLEQLTRP